MSSEIVAAVDGISESSLSDVGTAVGEGSNALGCIRPLGGGIRPLDLFRGIENPEFSVNLIDCNNHLSHFVSPNKGHRYLTQLNPTFKHVYYAFRSTREPSLMQLQGCDQVFLPLPDELPYYLTREPYLSHYLSHQGCDQVFVPDVVLSSESLKTLSFLEISDVSSLTFLPCKISEMTRLQTLNLSHLPVQQVPDDFFSNLTNLCSLILRDCPNVHSLPKFPPLTKLQYLDLSHLPIETLPAGVFADLNQLCHVILRGCSKLLSLPSTTPLENLKVLDLSHCTALQELESIEFHNCKLEMLDLSYTALHCAPILSQCDRLFFRDAKVSMIKLPAKVLTLDLSGAQNISTMYHKFQQERICYLEALDLSRNPIKSVGFLSNMLYLRYLILRECTSLQKLPAMRKLDYLEVLDISGCELLADLPEYLSTFIRLKELNISGCSCLRELQGGLFDYMSCLEKLDLSKTKINRLPSFAKLTNLQTLNLSQTLVEEVPVNLKELLLPNSQKLNIVLGSQTLADSETLDLAPPGSGAKSLQGHISKPNRFHLVSTYFTDSSFDRFRKMFDGLVSSISKFQKTFQPTSHNITNDPTTSNDGYANSQAQTPGTNTTNATNAAASWEIRGQTFSMLFRSMLIDLNYISDHIDLLESSHNCTSAEELLDELLDTSSPSVGHNIEVDSTNIYELLRLLFKLKLLVPPPKQVQGDALERKKRKEEEKDRFKIKRKGKKIHETLEGFDYPEITPTILQSFRDSYDILTDTERNCLLYFTLFPSCGKQTFFKERVLIHLWYAEGFIDREREEYAALSFANSPENPQTTPNSNLHLHPKADLNPDPGIEGTSTETGAESDDANPVSPQVSTTNGVYIPNTIEEIGRQLFLTLEQAEFIYRANQDKSKQTWGMTRGTLNFLTALAKEEGLCGFDHKNGKLTPDIGSQWGCFLKPRDNFPSCCKLTNSSKKVQSLKDIGALFNSNELIVDIRSEWFSKMRNLSVLHLGKWDHTSSGYPIEVADLKFLEELKNMKKLRLLSLEGFLTITEVPNSVCKLTNLKTLNLRECCSLEELPAGIGSLKNLTHLDLTDCRILYKLPKGVRLLSKLEVLKGFVINYQVGGQQPRDACTFKDLLKLEKLRKLNLVVNRDSFPDSKDLEVLKGMENLCNLKIRWEKNYNNDQQRCDNDKEPSKSSHLDNIQKLVLCCFPSDSAPSWLDPSQLQKLENLYIMGGSLKALPGDTSPTTWNVKRLSLRYLRSMYMDWSVLRCTFPHMIAFRKHECDLLSTFPCDEDGVWVMGDDESARVIESDKDE